MKTSYQIGRPCNGGRWLCVVGRPSVAHAEASCELFIIQIVSKKAIPSTTGRSSCRQQFRRQRRKRRSRIIIQFAINHHPVDICPESVNTIGIKLILLLFNYLIQLSNHFDTNTQHLRFVYLSIQILIIFYYEPIFRRIKTFLVNATAAFLLSESFWSPNPELFSVQSMCQLGRVLLKCHSNYFCRLAIFRLIYYQKRMSRPIKQLIEV